MTQTPVEAMVSLRRKLSVAASASVAAVLVVTAVLLVVWQRHDLMANVDGSLRRDADLVEAELHNDGVAAPGKPNEDRGMQVVDASGQVEASSVNLVGAAPLADMPTGRDRLRTVTGVPIEDDPYRLLSRRVEVGSDSYAVHLVANISDVNDSVHTLTESLLIAFPVVLALLALLTWWLVGRTLRPVTVASERQERFVSDASHELRTPLTRARTRLEVDLAHPDDVDARETTSYVLNEMIDMEHLIDDLLFLARPDVPRRPVRDELVDLDDLVFAEAAALRVEAPAIAVDTAEVSAARVRGDANELVRVVRNVLDNARRHAVGRVAISVTEAGEHAVLTVDDDGPGIPPEHRELVFGRFVRLEDARTPGSGSSGLGLAIARDIVDRHRGSIAASESATGGGRVVVMLPRA